MPTIDEIQLALTAEREKIERQLGIGDTNAEFARVAAAASAAKQPTAAKRARDKGLRREPLPVLPTRRSSRVLGVSSDGTPIPAPVAAAHNPGISWDGGRFRAPSGDVAWDETLWQGTDRKLPQDAVVAARLLDCIREGAAQLLGAPVPPPLTPLKAAAPPAEAAAAAAAPAEATASAAAADADGSTAPPPAALCAARAAMAGCGLFTEALAAARPDAGSWRPEQTRPAGALTRVAQRSERYVDKVTPDRIYTVALHPRTDLLIALAGDKNGHVGIWIPDMDNTNRSSSSSSSGSSAGAASKRARSAGGGGGAGSSAAGGGEAAADDDADAAEPEDDNDGGDGGTDRTALFRPHARPLSYLTVPPGAPHCVVTSSYDGTIRCLDLNVGRSLCLSTAALSVESGFSALEVDAVHAGAGASGIVAWAGAYDGTLYHIDSRVGVVDTAPHWQGTDKKVTCLSQRGHLLSSSGGSQVLLWDTRKLPRMTAAGAFSAASKGVAPLCDLAHPLGVTSAFFSPGGTRLLTCCNDNQLRVYDVHAAAASSSSSSSASSASRFATLRSSVAHDNHTGRWLSQFRAVWDPAGGDETFIIGAMSRQLEVYRASDCKREAAIMGDWVTAVGVLTAPHPSPSVHAVLSGNASGRMYLYT